MKKEKNTAEPRPRRKVPKRRSGTDTALSVGGGGLLGAGGAVLIQRFVDVDDRAVSGGMAALGAVVGGLGAAVKSPTVRDLGIGIAVGAGAVCVSDVAVAMGEETTEVSPTETTAAAPAPRNAATAEAEVRAIREELRNAGGNGLEDVRRVVREEIAQLRNAAAPAPAPAPAQEVQTIRPY